MAPKRTQTSPLERLQRDPYRFDFYQALRLLELASSKDPSAQASSEDWREPEGRPVGYDHAPPTEVVRVHVGPRQSFAGAEVLTAEPGEASAKEPPAAWKPWKMVISFFGLFGPQGALPQHYTQLIVDRVRRKDRSLRDFLDLFNHRWASFLYRAWSKYRLPIQWERHAREVPTSSEDPITRSLYAFVGFGTQGLRDRLRVPDAAWVHFGGHFSHYPRNAIALAQMIASYFCVPADIRQFQGQWLRLAREDQSRLGGRLGWGNSWHQQLGTDVVVGERVWSVENRFRLRIGPIDYTTFCRWLPDGQTLPRVRDFVRLYAGAEFDFDVQLVLRHDEVPGTQLAGRHALPTGRLGWNSWITNQPRQSDASDAVFEGGSDE